MIGTAFLTGASAIAVPVQFGVDFTSVGGNYSSSVLDVGYEFQVTSTVTVVGLAAWDINTPNGLPYNVPVGLWTQSGTLLASGIIASGTLPSDPNQQFAEVSITPIVLLPGFYDVAAVDAFAFAPNLPGFTTAPGISFIQTEYNSSSSLGFPGNTDSRYEGYFGGNIVLATPDGASTLLLLSGACMSLGALRRKLA